jgi:ketosteroid isomerase-like protein
MATDQAAITDLITRFGAAWNDHDLDAALALCTDDIVFESTGPAPDGERAEGTDAVRAAWAPIFENGDAQFTTEELIVTDDRAVSTWRYDWGEGHVRGVDVMKARDGKVCEKFSYVKG